MSVPTLPTVPLPPSSRSSRKKPSSKSFRKRRKSRRQLKDKEAIGAVVQQDMKIPNPAGKPETPEPGSQSEVKSLRKDRPNGAAAQQEERPLEPNMAEPQRTTTHPVNNIRRKEKKTRSANRGTTFTSEAQPAANTTASQCSQR